MPKEKQKAKNIAVSIRDNGKPSELTLCPELSYGEFRIGDDINKFINLVEKEPRGSHLNWDSYVAKDYDSINLWCSDSGLIYAIRFDEHCFFKGRNLIRMPIISFLMLLNKEPSKVEILWTPTKDDNHGQNQHVYDIDLNRSGSRGLQVWTWRKRIVSILVYDNSLSD